ncbi:MAG: hypothetical protein JXR77_00160, partial [Lentisphaeria bacterium]|nr:hypothetical protein [Lentisphaeria bacterium]
LNPDRSWRELTHVIHRWREPMTKPRPLPRPDLWLTIDRAATCRGLPGIYEQVRDAFWKAIDEGRFPGIREAPATP